MDEPEDDIVYNDKKQISRHPGEALRALELLGMTARLDLRVL